MTSLPSTSLTSITYIKAHDVSLETSVPILYHSLSASKSFYCKLGSTETGYSERTRESSRLYRVIGLCYYVAYDRCTTLLVMSASDGCVC